MTASGSALSSTRAVERAVELLAQVCDHGEISLAECARQAGLAPSTALRLLRTLEASGMVFRDGRGTFRAGPRLVQLGAAALSRQSLVATAEPALRRIVEACGESTYFSLPGPSETAVYAGMVEGLHSVRHTSWLGRSIPLRGTAAGTALRGETGAAEFVVVRSAVEPDVTAVAAAVFRSIRPGATRAAGGDEFTESSGRPVTGQVEAIGAISVVGPTYRINDDRAAFIGALVAAEARALTANYAGPAHPAPARHMTVVMTG